MEAQLLGSKQVPFEKDNIPSDTPSVLDVLAHQCLDPLSHLCLNV